MYCAVYRFKGFILFLLGLIFLHSFTFANVASSTIEGVVFDENDEPLAGANIMLTHLDVGASTSQDGRFTISKVPAGTYKVAVSFIGYKSETQTVELSSGEVKRLRFELEESLIYSEPVVVTGSPVAVDPLESPQDIDYISGREKIRIQPASLGETIESIPGVSNMSAGSVAGKPVIRGLTGERIRVMIDGVTQEYQQYGERHAPNIDPFNAERIEVIKGSASLLYGSDAIGGAINLIPHNFQFHSDAGLRYSGNATAAFRSNNSEFMSGAQIKSSTNKFALNASIVRRAASDFHTPDVKAFAETNKPGDPKFTGKIDHTDFEQLNGSIGAALLTESGVFSIRYDHYNNSNNFLLPTGGPIGLRLQNQTVIANGNTPLQNNILKTKISFQRNQRQASRPGLSRQSLPDSSNVDLISRIYTGRIEYEHEDFSGFSGTIGAEIKYYDHENVGLVPLQPTGYYINSAIFAFEEWQIDRFTVNFGLRSDFRTQEFMGTGTNPLLPDDDRRNFSSLSGSVGASYQIVNNATAVVNFGRGFRTPSFYNLYVFGYHGGVFAYQIGNPDLDNEISYDISSSLRYHTNRNHASITLYQNRIQNYIYLYNASDHPLAPPGVPFVFSHDQADAVLTGFVVSLENNLTNFFRLSGEYSQIASEFTQGLQKGGGLPLIPADNINAEARFLLPDLAIMKSPYFAITYKYYDDKAAAGIYEPFGQFDSGIGPDIPFGVASTDAHSLWGILAGFETNYSGVPIIIDLEITNLLDLDYRNFLDTYKGYTLGPGRSVNVTLNIQL